MLKDFLSTIPERERRRFATRICNKLLLSRDHWYNWFYGKSRMPVHAKNAIEKEARCRIFIGTEML